MVINEFLSKNADDQLINTADQISVFVHSYYFDKNLAFYEGSNITTVGVLYLEVLPKLGQPAQTFALDLPIDLSVHFTSTSKVRRKFKGMAEEDEFEVFIVPKGEVFINSMTHIVRPASVKGFLDYLMAGTLPDETPYSRLLTYVRNAASMNNFSLGVPSLLLEVMVSELCRNKDEETQSFRYVAGQSGAELGYVSAKIKDIPKLSSVFSGVSFENINEALISGVLLTKEGKEQKDPPSEKVLHY